MAKDNETTETVETPKGKGRPTNQVVATLASDEARKDFDLTRRALGIEGQADAVRQAVAEFVDNHTDERQKAVEFFGW